LAHTAAMHVAQASWKNRQGAAAGFDVVILPVKLRAAVVDVIEIKDPSQDPANRLGDVREKQIKRKEAEKENDNKRNGGNIV